MEFEFIILMLDSLLHIIAEVMDKIKYIVRTINIILLIFLLNSNNAIKILCYLFQ